MLLSGGRARALAVAVMLGVAACSDGPGPCTGDCTAAIVLAPIGLGVGGARDLVDGAEVLIEQPGQGGWVIYVGVRAQNVHGQSATLNAALRDLVTPQVVALEHRPVRLIDDGAGWARPDSLFQDLANVAVCSIVPGPGAFDRTSWRLELRLTDSDGRVAETTVTIRPVCSPDNGSDDCRCSCGVNGQCPQDVDAGVDAAPDAALDAAPDAP